VYTGPGRRAGKPHEPRACTGREGRARPRLRRALSAALAAALLALASPAAGLGTFPDVRQGDWFHPYVEALAADGRGIVSGYGSGNFGPYDHLLKAQFITMLVRLAGHDGLRYYSGYVGKALELGFVDEGDLAGLDRPIDRGAMIKMAVRYVEWTGEAASGYEAYERKVADYGKVAEGHREYVLKAYAMGIAEGGPGGFNAAGLTSRAAACKVIMTLIYPPLRSDKVLSAGGYHYFRGYSIRVEDGRSPLAYGSDDLQANEEVCFYVRLLMPFETQLDRLREALDSKFGDEFAEPIVALVASKDRVHPPLFGTFDAPGGRLIVVISGEGAMVTSVHVFMKK
ncbi:MAG: S-layer homology domain-containing protein, partial [Oscillospiraceae bacterium]|nr:S-layer homology domain-containing protein [Oscillospiraceae bacterium]